MRKIICDVMCQYIVVHVMLHVMLRMLRNVSLYKGSCTMIFVRLYVTEIVVFDRHSVYSERHDSNYSIIYDVIDVHNSMQIRPSSPAVSYWLMSTPFLESRRRSPGRCGDGPRRVSGSNQVARALSARSGSSSRTCTLPTSPLS